MPPGGPTVAEGPGSRGHACPSLAKAIEKVFRNDKPEVLDLGPMSGDTVVYFATLGARVTVDEFDPPALPPSTDDDDATPEPIHLNQPDGRFDLVLGWEQIDFVPPERLEEFVGELRRVMSEGGYLLLLSKLSQRQEAIAEDLRGRYHASGESVIERVPVEETPRQRWSHPTRSIERAMAGFSIQGVHLQRNQVREFLAIKKTAKRAVTKKAKTSAKTGGGRGTPKKAPGHSPTRARPVGRR
jgi:hypothetical protein